MEKPSLFKASTNYGLMLGGAAIVYSLLLYILGETGNQTLGYISFIFYIAFMVLGIKAYRDNFNGGFISYGNSFLLGFYIALIGGILTSIFTFILFKFIDPSLTDKMLEIARAKIEESGQVSEEQIDGILEMQKSMMSPAMIMVWGLLASAFFGAVLSLIVSIFMKKEGTPFDAATPDNTIQP